jgi:NAD(P)-dependent dehydrogenase (short-subunit alcohol dehydrogenase family)
VQSAVVSVPPEGVADSGRRTLLRRLGTADDIARAVLFLVSEKSGWVTDTALIIDSGIMTGG